MLIIRINFINWCFILKGDIWIAENERGGIFYNLVESFKYLLEKKDLENMLEFWRAHKVKGSEEDFESFAKWFKNEYAASLL